MATRQMKKRAGRAQNLPPATAEVLDRAANHEWTPIETWLLNALLTGATRKEIMAGLQKVWFNHLNGSAKRMAREGFREITGQRWFLDKLWAETKTEGERRAPELMKAMVSEGRRGNVNATKLVWEVTGQHAPQREAQPAHISISFGGIPRPTADIELEAEDAVIEGPGK